QSQVDTVVGNPPLGEVVGANPLRAITTAYQAFTGTGLLPLLTFLSRGQQLRCQQRHGLGAVFMLGALVLALYYDSGRNMRDTNRRFGLVHVLTTSARGTIGINPQVGWINVHRLH